MALRPGDADGRFPLCAEDAGMLGLEPPQFWTPDGGKVLALRRPDKPTELWLFEGAGCQLRRVAQLTGILVKGLDNLISEAKRRFQWSVASLIMGALRSLGGCSAHADRR
jgi:hypothetical protein